MHRVHPTVLGILLIAGGLCAALPFRKLATQRAPQSSSAEAEGIEWRSNDFTLEVNAQPLKETVAPHERPASPAFGQGSQAMIRRRASLDHVPEPPSLAGDYESAASEPGADQVTAVDKPVVPVAPLETVAITHTIADGDTLEDLAEEHLGSRLRWTEIYNANPEILDDPEVLPLGVTIVILPRLQPSTSPPVTAADGLVPVSSRDLQRFRDPSPTESLD